MGELNNYLRNTSDDLWSRCELADFQWAKRNPPHECEGFQYVLRLGAYRAKRCTRKVVLLCLTEDTVDLGTADWADALCHATT